MYIITSKTRARIMRQPKEHAKLLSERRASTAERHQVLSVTPTDGKSEVETHDELDRMGSFVADSMAVTRANNAERAKKKREAREEARKATVKERLAQLESRDKKNGVASEARQFAAKRTRR